MRSPFIKTLAALTMIAVTAELIVAGSVSSLWVISTIAAAVQRENDTAIYRDFPSAAYLLAGCRSGFGFLHTPIDISFVNILASKGTASQFELHTKYCRRGPGSLACG